MSDIDWARIARDLAAPFPAADLKTKPSKGGGQLTYIDARTVAERLDSVVGPEHWHFDWQPMIVSDDAVHVVKGTLTIYGISKSDIGDSEKIEPNKGAVSDALKRAAVLWGIGRYLYGIESPQAARAAAQQQARPAAESTPGRAVGPGERRAPSAPTPSTPTDPLPTGVVINPGVLLAGRAFRAAAETAGFATKEAQDAFAREQYPGRRLASLTEDEWRALELKCRAMYSDVPSEEPIFS